MIKLPPECFLNQSGDEQIKAEFQEHFEVTEVGLQVGKGTFFKIEGAEFPCKPVVNTESLFAANMVKALFMESLKIGSMWQFIPAVVITFLFKNKRQKLIDSFERIGWKIMSPHLLKHPFLTEFTQAFHFVVFRFLMKMDVEESQADKVALIFVHLFEFDSAYLWRAKDIVGELQVGSLHHNPRSEFKRLLQIALDREITLQGDENVRTAVYDKLLKIGRIASWVLLIPKVKRAIRSVAMEAEFDRMKPDEADIYWMCQRKDYAFMGRSYAERMEFLKEKGWKLPELIKE